MNSKFKENSRFASLIEEKPIKSNNKVSDNIKNEPQNKMEDKPKTNFSNSFKNDQPSRENNSFYKSYKERNKEIMERIEKEEILKKNEEDDRKEKEKKIALAMESFPELVISKTKVIENTTNFLEKLKTNAKVDIPVKNVLKQGWIELTREKLSNSTIIFSNIKRHENEYIKTAEDLTYDVIDYLVDSYNKRKDEYINNWGEDEWEQMFKFKNYDYHYFDKLDDIYEKNNPNSYDENYENDEFEEDEYWKKN